MWRRTEEVRCWEEGRGLTPDGPGQQGKQMGGPSGQAGVCPLDGSQHSCAGASVCPWHSEAKRYPVLGIWSR